MIFVLNSLILILCSRSMWLIFSGANDKRKQVLNRLIEADSQSPGFGEKILKIQSFISTFLYAYMISLSVFFFDKKEFFITWTFLNLFMYFDSRIASKKIHSSIMSKNIEIVEENFFLKSIKIFYYTLSIFVLSYTCL